MTEKMHPSLVDADAVAASAALDRARLDDLVGYWVHGHRILTRQLAEAVARQRGDDWYSHAPMGLAPEAARAWHVARVEGYRHALDMMGVPEGFGIPTEAV